MTYWTNPMIGSVEGPGQDYGAPRSSGFPHAGYDIGTRGAPGRTVVAGGDGTVIEVDNNISGARGRLVMIDHGGNVRTLYQHLASISVSVGQAIAAGQVIGVCGGSGLGSNTGYAIHLHLEVLIGGSGTQKSRSMTTHPKHFFADRGVTLGVSTPSTNPNPTNPTTPTQERTMRVIRAVNDPRVFSTDGVRLVHLTTQGQVNDMLRIAGQSEVDIVGQETVSTLGVTDDALVTKVWSRTLGAIAGADRTAGVGLRMAALAAAGQPVS